MKDWSFMTLEGALQTHKVGSNTTFIKKIPAQSSGVPDLLLGLGWFSQVGLPKASLSPHAEPSKMVFANIIISEVSTSYAKHSKSNPNDWLLYVLLENGYVTEGRDENLTETRRLNRITVQHLQELLQTYSYPEIFFILLAGLERNPEEWMEALRSMRSMFPDKDFGEALPYIRLGADPSVLIENMKLPYHVVKEIYS